MANVLLVAYLLIVLAMIAVILLQRSEGGGLGMGSGGGGGGGLMTSRGSANLLTRTTAILAALFMATAIGLTIITEINRGSDSILDSASQSTSEDGGPSSVLDALNSLQGEDDDLPVPAAPEEEAAPADETGSSEEEAPAQESGNDLDLAVPEPAADDTGAGSTGN